MNYFINLKQLNTSQLAQYKNAVSKAFPPIIGESQIIKKYWTRLENYFPEYQLFLISAIDEELIGFMNTLPFAFNRPIKDLPQNGWDWMFKKGISDYENNAKVNYIGGLQVIVRKNYQQRGFSKQILDHSKQVLKSTNLQSLIIPIRPTKKHIHPKMSMHEYLHLKEEEEIYDPWIRTHVKSGAQIIKVCERSMSINGNIDFWQKLLDTEVLESGQYLLKGALSPIDIDVKNNIGKYIEANIWIKYD